MAGFIGYRESAMFFNVMVCIYSLDTAAQDKKKSVERIKDKHEKEDKGEYFLQ